MIFLESCLNPSKQLLVVLGCFGFFDVLLGFLGAAAIILTHARLDVVGHDGHWVPSWCIIRVVHLVLDVRDRVSQRWSAGLSWDNGLCLLLGAILLCPV